MGERRGTKGLELWCKRMTEGYPGVKIDNMTTSWRDGLAFCAIIHHFRPELIDFKKLKKEDVYANNELAFRVAEQYLGIPALLEAEDMVEYLVPDRLSILTYLSQFYQAFAVTQGTPSRMVPKRPANSTGIVSPASTSPPNKKMPIPGVDVLRLKPCAKCSLPVFFAERLNVAKLLYHRTCFRCARCNNQLTLSNSYETETPNQYCCETCPDEESTPTSPDKITGGSADKAASTILIRSLSDEEKTAGLKSYMFETALEQHSIDFKPRESSAGIARKSFLQMNMLPPDNSPRYDGEVQMPELPRSARPSVLVLSEFRNSEHQSDIIDVDVNSNRDSGRPHSAIDNVHSSNVNSPIKDVKVQSATAEDFSGSSMVKARMRIFEKKCDPFTTKVTEIDLSKVTKPKVTIVEDEFNDEKKEANFEQVDNTSLNVVDLSDSINLVIKENTEDAENVQADSTYESIITISDESVSLPDDKLSKTEYKTTCEDSIISISDQSFISPQSHESDFLKFENSSFDDKLRNTQYLTTTEHSNVSVSAESDILQELIKSECTDLHEKSLDDESSTTEYKTTCKDSIISISGQSYISREPDESDFLKLDSTSFDDKLINTQYRTTTEHSNVSVSEESDILQELIKSECTDLHEKSLDAESSKTEYKTTCRDSIISISSQSYISRESDESDFLKLDNTSFDDKLRNTQYLTSTEHSNISVSEESDILQELIKSECTDLHKKSLDDESSKTEFKISSEMPISDVSHETSTQLDQSESIDKNSISSEERLSTNEYKIPYEDHSTNDPTNISELEPSLNNLSAEDNSENMQDLPLLSKIEDVQVVEEEITSNVGVQVEEEEITSNVQFDSGLQSMQPSTIENTRCTSTRESYPGELNPFGNDADAEQEGFQKQSSSNPFDEDECEEQQEVGTPPPFRRLIKLHDEDKISFTPESIHITRVSEVYPPMSTVETTPEFKKPVAVTRKRLQAPKISLTPFWDSEYEDSKPTSRQSRSSVDQTFSQPQPRPRASDVSSSIVSPYGSSTTSLSSITTTSSVQSGKKKKAPAPPKPSHDSEQNSLTSSPSTSVQHSPRSTPRPRKSKKAPAPPPALASTPSGLIAPHSKMSISPIQFDNTKVAKDEVNRNRQSQTLNEPTSPTTITHLPDKSMFGKWKRKKSMAPDKPVAIRRTIKELPMVEVKRELDIIEVQQQGLERQGVKLEHIIRMRCESPDSELNEDNIPIEVEDMILQLFEVVNEKNELCRRQAELMYLKKQHRLDEEHAEVEYQIRCLMLMSDQNKTDTDKSKEEELIKRLLEIVEKKNEIIECLDMDRVREHEEDHSFTSSMNSYANRRDAAATITTTSSNATNIDEKHLSKKEKKKLRKKFKLKIGGSHQQVDADKDIDETEVNQAKEKKKKRFAIF